MRYQTRSARREDARFIPCLIAALAAGLFLTMARAGFAADFTVLHAFGAGLDGSGPQDSLIVDGLMLYGMTSGGGVNSAGTIFAYDLKHSHESVLHSFGSDTDGANPKGSLVLSDRTLYGMTSTGGIILGGFAVYSGTIFSYDLESAHEVAHVFDGTAGTEPNGSLTISGSTLYGMTRGGQTTNSNDSVIFNVVVQNETTLSRATVLHTFNDEDKPTDSLVLDGSTLYGMTNHGGSKGRGSIFSCDIDGGTYSTLHSFGNTGDGSKPTGSLILDGTTLYGTTTGGGDHKMGAIVAYDTQSGNEEVLYSFVGGQADGSNPQGDLILDGSTLYGMTFSGGANSNGVIFSYDISTGIETVLHDFTKDDGTHPMGSLLLDHGTLYGMTSMDGTYNGGTLFAYNIPEPAPLTLLILGGMWMMALRLRGRRLSHR